MVQGPRTYKYFELHAGVFLCGSVAAWMGGEFEGEWIHVYAWLSPFAMHMKLSQIVNRLYSNIKLKVKKKKRKERKRKEKAGKGKRQKGKEGEDEQKNGNENFLSTCCVLID